MRRAALLAGAAVAIGLLAWGLGRERAGGPPEEDRVPEKAQKPIDTLPPSAVALAEHPGRLADAAGVLDVFRNTLEWQTQAWYDDLGIDVHVVSLPSRRRSIEKLAETVFELRRIGEDAPSGGLLVLLNPTRGEARIEVSYALEHVFPDLRVGRIARDQLAPYAAYRVSGMAVMDALHFLKDIAYLKAARGEFEPGVDYRARPGFAERSRYLAGGAGARASLAEAVLGDRDFKAPVAAERRARYEPSQDPQASAEAYLRALGDSVGDPTLELYTPGTRCMLDAYPYAPFEQLERLERIEASRPLRVAQQGDRAVLDSERPAHGFVPILLQRIAGRWRIDLVETWKNLFFDATGEYRQHNSNHPYAFALARFGRARLHDVAAWSLDSSELAERRERLAARGKALDEFWLGELLYRNCWLPLHALAHYERAAQLAPTTLLFQQSLGDRAAYLGFHDLAAEAYEASPIRDWIELARQRRAAGDLGRAVGAVRSEVDRNPYDLEALGLLRDLLEERDDAAGAREIERRIAEVRANPARPGAPVTVSFEPARPALQIGEPTRVGETEVFDHSSFAATLTNTSQSDVELVSVIVTTSGDNEEISGLGDVKDHWRHPTGGHVLRAGESRRFERIWGYTTRTGNRHVRYHFDVCWKGVGEQQCRDGAVDTFSE